RRSSDLYTLLLQSTHDLGKCPAVWVSHKPFSYENDIVRKSMFSYVREELEEYVFMKTLRKMAEVNGAIPVTVRLKGTSVDKSGNDLKRSVPQTPMSANSIGSQSATIGSDNTPSDSPMQVGTEIIVPAQRKE
ncbi:hypothetical protein RZS08_37540, partial [Arthrospira platensis SPKY1]|nr:hypothetical protein [Arthrospira platensis SPKY1]